MSRLNWKIWVQVVVFWLLGLFYKANAQNNPDQILSFYTERAAATFKSRNPIEAGISFGMRGKTYFRIYDDTMIPRINDSLISDYFYSFGHLDSVIQVVKSTHKQDSLDFSYPNIFNGDYIYNFYPNDTGGKELAIGFDSKDYNTKIPVGLAIIDRNRYFLLWLHLHYISERRDERRSKSFRFTEFEGYIFPDSVWEIKARRGVLTTEFYRIETGLSDFKIFR